MAIVEQGGVLVETRRRTNYDRRMLLTLQGRFVNKVGKDSTDAERELASQQQQLCTLMSHTNRWVIGGEEIPLLTIDSVQPEFDAAFARFERIDELFTADWLESCIDMQKPYNDAAHAPDGSLTKEQAGDPNSAAPVKKPSES